jgi:hypothetical protein
MNDDDLTLIIRDSLADIRMTIPVTDVIRRGQSFRTRRRRAGSGVSVALATIGALVAGLLVAHLPHHAHGTNGRIQLAAFTVTRQSADSVSVTIRQLTDLSGLQAALRADGIPVVVTNSINIPAGCSEWHGGRYSTAKTITLADKSGLPNTQGVEFSIHPSAIPEHAVLSLGLMPTGAPANSPGPPGPMSVGLLASSPTCPTA